MMRTRISSPELTGTAAAGKTTPAAGTPASKPAPGGGPTTPAEIDAALNALKGAPAPQTPVANPNALRRARLTPPSSSLAASAAEPKRHTPPTEQGEGPIPFELECAHIGLLGTTNEVAADLASHLEGLRRQVEGGLDNAQCRAFGLEADHAMEQIIAAHEHGAIDESQCSTLVDFLSNLRRLANQ